MALGTAVGRFFFVSGYLFFGGLAMSKTSMTSDVPYATPADLLVYHDAGKVGDYVSDEKQLTKDELLNDPVVYAALMRASGEVEAACCRGGRYRPEDLQGLTGASREFLRGLVCDLAFFHLAKRRIPDPQRVPGYEQAIDVLKALSTGDLVFGFVETVASSHMNMVDISTDSVGRYHRLTEMCRRFWGPRADRFTSNPIRGYR